MARKKKARQIQPARQNSEEDKRLWNDFVKEMEGLQSAYKRYGITEDDPDPWEPD